MRYRQFLAVALAATMAAACGGGGASSGGTPTETTPPPSGGGALASLALSPSSGTLPVGGSFQLTALAKDAAGNVLTGLPSPTFQSSDPAKASVDANGLVTGLAAGAVTIRATLAAGGATHTATADLTVTAAPPPPPPPPSATFTSLTLSPDAGSVNVGATLHLTATPRDQNGAAMTGLPAPTFASSDAGRATVDASGLVRGVAAGPVTITASLTHNGVTRQAAASLTVVEQVAPSAAVSVRRSGFSPPAVTIAVGGSVTWTMVDDDHDVTFTGTAPAGGNIGRVEEGTSASRTFTQAGTYSYRCTRHDIHGTVDVKTGSNAQPPTYTSLTVSPSSGSVQVGATLQLTATARDQYGAAMSGLGSPQWSTSNPAVATVSASGVVTGVAAGTATITATLASGGTTRTATAAITVTTTSTPPPPPPPPPGNPSTATVTTPGESFSPQTVTIAAGGTVTWQISGATHNVTFSGAAPTGGNIPDTRSGSVSRTFPAAGTYNYQCTRHSGMTGQVVVQ